MRRPRGHTFNRAALARAAGVLAITAAIVSAAVYLAVHQASPKTIALPPSSSSAILVEDEA